MTGTPRHALDALMALLVDHKIGPRKYDLPHTQVRAVRLARTTIRQQAMRIIELEEQVEELRARRKRNA